MSFQSRLVARTIFETLLMIVSWGLVVGAIIAFIAINSGLGIGLIIGAVIGFIIHASSVSSRPTSELFENEINRVNSLLEQGRYPQAHALAEKNARALAGENPLSIIAHMQLAFAATAAGDGRAALAASRTARSVLLSFEQKHRGSAEIDEFARGLDAFLTIVERYLNYPVGSTQNLIDRYIELNRSVSL